jgi:AraC-like DNA-binding protein
LDKRAAPDSRGRPVKEREDLAKGLLGARPGPDRLRLARYLPSDDLAGYVEHHWVVEWDFRGQPAFEQENVPHPAIHLVFEREGARLYGVMRRRFVRRLAGRDRVFGVKFHPGGFRPLLGRPVRTIADAVLPAADLFGAAIDDLAETLLTLPDHAAMVASAERFLREALVSRAAWLETDPSIALATKLVEAIAADRSILRVEDLAGRSDMSVRTLQRLFGEYVGASPKWTIQRCRLLDAADRIRTGDLPDWPTLARDLGYFDQAHFIRDFKSLVGHPPATYARALGSSGSE